ncbi:SurA N-terminal domain-containing protein [Dokdonella sp.]|uniref:SurA N-terminal domain-containing protein n=1 Tax=Dokdonella sp. TaxID=2291710 RepID=UPI0031C5FC69|nr:SurA N-terminal domain-containing protein [Dokdonella sp.]
MLQLLRGKKSGFLVKVALVLITIGFSFFGIESYFVSNASTTVAKVGKNEITQDQFRDRFNEYRQRMQQLAGGSLEASFFERPEIKRQVLDQMINEQVLLAANDKLGITVPAEQVRKEILGVPAFQVDGHFDADQYRILLASQGMSPLMFENRVRQDLAVRALPEQVGTTAMVTPAEVDAYLRLQNQLRDFQYIRLDRPAPGDAQITDEEIQAWYTSHQDDFMVPEQVALEYVELDADQLQVNLTPDDATLKERYEKEKQRFESPEERLASHILVKVGGKGSPEDQKAALAKAEAIEAQLKEGKDFAELAKAESDDLGSKNQGGDLGWLEKGTTDEAFENALFALKKGEVSAPVLGADGYHIIELRDIRPGKTRSFEEVKPELEHEYAQSERDRVFAEQAGRLTDLTYQDPSSLEPAAHELGIKVHKTALFSRQGGQGIAANPAVVKAAFSDSVLVQDNNSDPIELGPNHIVVVRIAEHKAATPIPLDQVRDKVRQQIVDSRIAQKAKDQAADLLAAAEQGESLQQIAAAHQAKVEMQQGIGREAASVDSALVSAVFAMPRPQEGKPALRTVDLGGDVYALVQLDKVIDGNPSGLDPKTREAARNTLHDAFAAEASRALIQALRKEMKIEVYEDKLQDL